MSSTTRYIYIHILVLFHRCVYNKRNERNIPLQFSANISIPTINHKLSFLTSNRRFEFLNETKKYILDFTMIRVLARLLCMSDFKLRNRVISLCARCFLVANNFARSLVAANFSNLRSSTCSKTVHFRRIFKIRMSINYKGIVKPE